MLQRGAVLGKHTVKNEEPTSKFFLGFKMLGYKLFCDLFQTLFLKYILKIGTFTPTTILRFSTTLPLCYLRPNQIL